MIARISLISLSIAAAATLPLRGEDSPISSRAISADDGPAAVAASQERGTASAEKDIKAGTFRILYFGIPWPVNKPLVDKATGYRVQVVGGCVAGTTFAAEVNAYNGVMRDWHDKHK